ncbi:hypothetical protein MLD52_19535 [Puniceicoccaceae bacterium K14]|nr:hypothetical protein [Puniceicoccaceae bacterium K14]
MKVINFTSIAFVFTRILFSAEATDSGQFYPTKDLNKEQIDALENFKVATEARQKKWLEFENAMSELAKLDTKIKTFDVDAKDTEVYEDLLSEYNLKKEEIIESGMTLSSSGEMGILPWGSASTQAKYNIPVNFIGSAVPKKDSEWVDEVKDCKDRVKRLERENASLKDEVIVLEERLKDTNEALIKLVESLEVKGG